MLKFIILVLVLILTPPLVSISIADGFTYGHDNKDIDVSITDPQLKSGERAKEFIFYIRFKNGSAVKKFDMDHPFDVRVTDEFNNTYHPFKIQSNTERDVVSLYPSEEMLISCSFQAPVAGAKKITIRVSDGLEKIMRNIHLETKDIKNWTKETAIEITADDLEIIYPKEKKVFAPGDTIYLLVGFSERAGRPRNLHVVLPDYVLSDEQAAGQYELKIPPDSDEGNMEIVVMAEWGSPPESRVISKTLFLEIKG